MTNVRRAPARRGTGGWREGRVTLTGVHAHVCGSAGGAGPGPTRAPSLTSISLNPQEAKTATERRSGHPQAAMAQAAFFKIRVKGDVNKSEGKLFRLGRQAVRLLRTPHCSTGHVDKGDKRCHAIHSSFSRAILSHGRWEFWNVDRDLIALFSVTGVPRFVSQLLLQERLNRMPRGRSTFRQRDLRAAVKAVRDAGAKVTVVELRPDGSIKISTDGTAADGPRDELTEWMGRHARSA